MKKLLILLAVGALVVAFFANSGSPFDIPWEINYQGMLTDNEGSPLNGNYDILFKIYNHPSSGAMQWQELQEDVLVQEGIFNVVLGSVNPINLNFYEVERYWLDITVEGEHMPSRINFVSVPFAYRAETADFAHFAAGVTEDYSDDRYVNVNGPDSVRGSSSSAMLRVKNYGSGDGIYLYTPTSLSGDGIYIDSAGNYGIWIMDTGDDAIRIDDSHARGIEMIDTDDDGIYMDDIGDRGIYMLDVASHGIQMWDIEGDGINIYDAAGNGIYIDKADHGVYVDSSRSGYDGFMVRYAEDDGFNVSHANDHGLYVGSVGDDGLYVSSATDNGVYVSSADRYGIWAHGDEGNLLESEGASYWGLKVYSYTAVSTNPGLKVYGYGEVTGTWSTKWSGSSGDVPGFMLSSRDVEMIASGTGSLVNGQAQITFDQKFQEAMSTEIPVKVVLTAQGAPSGLLYVASKSNQGFSVERLEISDLAMKSDDITFDWIAIARQKGYEQRPEVLLTSEEELAAEELAELQELEEEQQELEREAAQLEEMLKQQARDEAEREEQSTD